jgi:hypothetical protein
MVWYAPCLQWIALPFAFLIYRLKFPINFLFLAALNL